MTNKTLLFVVAVVVVFLGYYLSQELEETRMSYAAWQAANSVLNLQGKRALVVGGTQGIGAGVAVRFSQLGSSVVIAGRNETLAKEVISEMQKNRKSDEQEFKFMQFDATLFEDLKRFTKEVKQYFEAKGGVDYIIQSQGILNSALSLTTEGHDRAFMLNCYSKWYITNNLLPLLKESNIYICAPATHGSIDFNDVELHKSSRFPGTPGNRDGVFLDSMTVEFQERYPKKRFYHLFPGVVETNIMKNSLNFPFVGFLSNLLKVIGRSPITFADLPIYIATQDKKGGVSMNEKGKLYTPYDWIKNAENRAKLWAWNEELEKQHSKL